MRVAMGVVRSCGGRAACYGLRGGDGAQDGDGDGGRAACYGLRGGDGAQDGDGDGARWCAVWSRAEGWIDTHVGPTTHTIAIGKHIVGDRSSRVERPITCKHRTARPAQ